MKTALLITGDTVDLGPIIAETFLKNGYRVAMTVQDEQAAEPLDEEHSIIPWQLRSPLSARNVVLNCMEKYGSLDEAVVIFSPTTINSPLHEVSALLLEQSVDVQIKGLLFILKEILAGFQKAGRGRISLVLNLPESEVLPPLAAMGTGSFKQLTGSLFAFYQNEAPLINGFELHSNNVAEFGVFLFDILTGKSKDTHGKWYKHGDKNFFESLGFSRK